MSDAGGGAKRSGASAERAKAWLVTGPLGRGLSFAIDFAMAVRNGLFSSRNRS